MKKKSLIGEKFECLEVIADAPSIRGKSASLCRCVCGMERIFRNNSLTHITHPVKSCGCKTKELISKSNSRDLTTEKFSSLQPIEVVGRKNGHLVWKCKCDCGNFKNCSSSDLVQGCVTCCGFCKRSTLERDLTGQRFGKLVVLNKEANIGVKTAWRVKCDCGKENITKTGNLLNGHARSCGCEINYNKVQLLGQKFGRLTALEMLGVENNHRQYWCRCDCGKELLIDGPRLSSGTTKSCGCLQKELAIKRMKLLVGVNSPNWKGGTIQDYDARKTKEYNQWKKSVLKRDHKTCVICSTDKLVEAHHLNAFLKFKEQRYLIDNGVCLCRFCHKLFHLEYGSGDNTKEQFEEFRAKLGV